MNIGEILIWESSNLLLLIPGVIGVVMLVRWLQGRAAFTERDWLLLFGQPREKAFTLRLWLRFAGLLLAVVTIGFGPRSLRFAVWVVKFTGALILVPVGVLLLAPKCLC